jgi:serine/threonine protein kinase
LPGKSKDTTPLGSPGYAPPEQYGRAQTDQRADIYSLGATLQTMLTGLDPLELRAGEPSRNPRLPSRALRKLLDEMLSPEVAARPVSMAEVKKRLEFILNCPLVVYVAGLTFGATVSVLSLLPTLFWSSSNFFFFSAILAIARIVDGLVRKKLKLPIPLPKGFKRFWWFGLLSAALIFTLFGLLFSSLWHGF